MILEANVQPLNLTEGYVLTSHEAFQMCWWCTQDLSEFRISVVYMASYRPARAIQTCLRKQTQTQTK